MNVDKMYYSIPDTIETIKAIYFKVFLSNPIEFPCDILDPKVLVNYLILYFSTLASVPNDMFISNLSTILRVISCVKPDMYETVVIYGNMIDSLTNKLNNSPALHSLYKHLDLQSIAPCIYRKILNIQAGKCEDSDKTLNKKKLRRSFIMDAEYPHECSVKYIKRLSLNGETVEPCEQVYKRIGGSTAEIDTEIIHIFKYMSKIDKRLDMKESLLATLNKFSHGHKMLISIWNESIRQSSVNQNKDGEEDNDVATDRNATLTGSELSMTSLGLPIHDYHNDSKRKKSASTNSHAELTKSNSIRRNNCESKEANVLRSKTHSSLCLTEKSADSNSSSDNPQQLKDDLRNAKETIARLMKNEETLRTRFASQVQKEIEKGGRFENVNARCRPTELIRAYENLYSEMRIDTLDALDSSDTDLRHSDHLKSKLLFSIVVLAFRSAHLYSREIRLNVRHILQLTSNPSSSAVTASMDKHLRATVDTFDLSAIVQEVETQIWSTLYDYPTLKTCGELLKYIRACCRVAWGLVNQAPPYVIDFQRSVFDKGMHERFHTSSDISDDIEEYIWPSLIDSSDKKCVSKGYVITTISKSQ